MTLYFLFLLITGGISAAIIHICKLPASPDACAMAVVPLHALFCMMKGKLCRYDNLYAKYELPSHRSLSPS